MANPVLAEVQKKIEESSLRTASHIAALEDTVSGVNDVTAAIMSEIDNLASSAKIKNTQEQVEEARAQNASIAVQQAAGGRDAQVALMQELEQDNQRVDAAAEQVLDVADDEITGVAVFDTIINSFRNLQNEVELEAATAKRNATSTRITSITQAQEQFARANALTKETVNQATIEAGNAAIEAQARLDKRKAELDGMLNNARMVGVIMNADARGIEILQDQMRLSNTAEANEFRKLQIQQLKKQIADKKVSDADIVDNIQNAQSAMGLTVQNSETILAAFNESGAVGQNYQQLFLIGSTAGPDGNVRYGNSAYQAATTLATFDPNGNVDNKYTDTLDAVNDEVQKKIAEDPKVSPKNDEEYGLLYEQTAREVATDYQSEIVTGDNSNPYHAPPMESITEQANVQATAFYRNVPSIQGMTEFDPARIKEAGIEGISAGLITQEEYINGMVAFANSAMALNNSMQGGLTRYGLPAQTEYIVRMKYQIPTFSAVLGTRIPKSSRTENKLVDISRPDEVSLDLVKSLAGLPQGTVSGDNE